MVIIASFYFLLHNSISDAVYEYVVELYRVCQKIWIFFVILQEEGNKDIVEETVLSYIKLCGEYTG